MAASCIMCCASSPKPGDRAGGMRQARQLTALALRSLAGALPAAAGLLWPRLLPEASARVVLPFAVAGWLTFRIPLPRPVTHGPAWFRSYRERDAFRGPDGLIVGRTAQPDHIPAALCGAGPSAHYRPHSTRRVPRRIFSSPSRGFLWPPDGFLPQASARPRPTFSSSERGRTGAETETILRMAPEIPGRERLSPKKRKGR